MKIDPTINEPLVIEKVIAAPAGKIWQALTDKEKMKQWYFDVDDFKAEAGFEFHFDGENEGRVFHHICVVTEAIRNQRLAYTWKYQGYPGSSVVCFELITQGEKINLRVTHSGLDTFPQDNGDFSKRNFTMGWTHIIGTALPGYLEKTD